MFIKAQCSLALSSMSCEAQTTLDVRIETPISHRMPVPLNLWDCHWAQKELGSLMRKSVPSKEKICYLILYDSPYESVFQLNTNKGAVRNMWSKRNKWKFTLSNSDDLITMQYLHWQKVFSSMPHVLFAPASRQLVFNQLKAHNKWFSLKMD